MSLIPFSGFVDLEDLKSTLLAFAVDPASVALVSARRVQVNQASSEPLLNSFPRLKLWWDAASIAHQVLAFRNVGIACNVESP